jgi:hypothetical protein
VTIEGRYVVAGTGPRNLRIAPPEQCADASNRLVATLVPLKEKHGEDLTVMSGLAEGWDELVAITAIRLDIALWAAVPNRTYGRFYWSARQSVMKHDRVAEFDRILERAWRVTYVMEQVHRTSKLWVNGEHANMLRNTWMVTGAEPFPGADEFLVWNPTSGGTADCFGKILESGKPWKILSPDQLPEVAA